jgi:hypothetical protein
MGYEWKSLLVTILEALLESTKRLSLPLALQQILVELKTNFITLVIYSLAITILAIINNKNKIIPQVIINKFNYDIYCIFVIFIIPTIIIPSFIFPQLNNKT